ncbi:MAG: ribbon-helix-helix protein, CopG family [Candidatus Lokiarchaeota archaeon]|nr:ribbon-helix-helix protein, CopG family [Candidatus Lokiarchaeota archaeon]MBD3341556.1 ribbon-helix-helix protein, CopG family [Candidatus Lokiarchaeota archaeon]
MKKISKTISTRIDDKDAEKLDKIAERENIDRSALVRKFILQKLKEYDIKEMTELYQKGVVSLQEAASQANVSLYDIMEYVQKENIRPPDQTKEEIIAEIEESKKYFE